MMTLKPIFNMYRQYFIEKGCVVKDVSIRGLRDLKTCEKDAIVSFIVLARYHNPLCKEFDFYRTPPLLCNKALVIHEDICEECNVSGLKNNLIFAKYGVEFVDKIKELLALNQNERDALSEKHYQYFKKKWKITDFPLPSCLAEGAEKA